MQFKQSPMGLAHILRLAYEDDRQYISIDEAMKEMGVARKYRKPMWHDFYPRTVRMLRSSGFVLIPVTREIDDTTDLNDRTLLAGVAAPHQQGFKPMQGVYFSNGTPNCPLFNMFGDFRYSVGGAIVGNQLHESSVRRAEGLIDDSQMRHGLKELAHSMLKEGNAEANKVIRKQIPTIPRNIGGQYPLGIEK